MNVKSVTWKNKPVRFEDAIAEDFLISDEVKETLVSNRDFGELGSQEAY